MKPIVLMYHDVYVTNPEESGFNTPGALHYKISKEMLEAHLNAISNFCESKQLKKEDVIFTFDDGGVSFYDVIAPMLEKYGWYGHFFISTHYIGTAGFLSAAQIKELRDRGHIVGSHSHHHKVLTEKPLIEVENELKQSLNILSDILNERITTISIPNGCYSESILDIAINEGLTTIYTSKPTTTPKTYNIAELIGRYSIAYNTSATDVMRIITQTSLRKRMEIKYNILQMVKVALGSKYSKWKMWIRTHLIK